MNGWQRLFVVLAVPVMAIAGVVVTLDRPTHERAMAEVQAKCELEASLAQAADAAAAANLATTQASTGDTEPPWESDPVVEAPRKNTFDDLIPKKKLSDVAPFKRLGQIQAAMAKAHEAGAFDDARRLAQQYVATSAPPPPAGFELCDGPNAVAEQYEEDSARWTTQVWQGLGGTAVALLILYIAGWSLGWVWRGFFPRKQMS